MAETREQTISGAKNFMSFYEFHARMNVARELYRATISAVRKGVNPQAVEVLRELGNAHLRSAVVVK